MSVTRTQAVRVTAAILLVGFGTASGFTIGVFSLPAAIVMLLAACVGSAGRIAASPR